jgi:hypothetical protein
VPKKKVLVLKPLLLLPQPLMLKHVLPLPKPKPLPLQKQPLLK